MQLADRSQDPSASPEQGRDGTAIPSRNTLFLQEKFANGNVNWTIPEIRRLLHNHFKI
jgi:hypothetical protein